MNGFNLINKWKLMNITIDVLIFLILLLHHENIMKTLILQFISPTSVILSTIVKQSVQSNVQPYIH